MSHLLNICFHLPSCLLLLTVLSSDIVNCMTLNDLDYKWPKGTRD